MPIPFRRRERLSPDFFAVPAEPPMVTPDEGKVADIDDKLTAIAEIPRDDRSEGLVWQENRLLDLRNAIRPARPRPVPAIPDRVDSIIDNYWENP
jgi:hypothetical protein